MSKSQAVGELGPGADEAGRAVPDRPSRSHAGATMVFDIVAPIALYYGLRAAGQSVWVSLIVSAVAPALSALIQAVTRRRVDGMGLLVLATIALGAVISLISGSPRALLARDGLLTAAWAGYMYASLLARRPATFVISRPLLEGRRLYDPGSRRWFRPTGQSWDELWERVPAFRRIWRTAAVIWGTAILADAVIRVVMAYTLPIRLVPALGGALWPVTFIALQVITNVYFARAGFWRILQAGGAPSDEEHHEDDPVLPVRPA